MNFNLYLNTVNDKTQSQILSFEFDFYTFSFTSLVLPAPALARTHSFTSSAVMTMPAYAASDTLQTHMHVVQRSLPAVCSSNYTSYM